MRVDFNQHLPHFRRFNASENVANLGRISSQKIPFPLILLMNMSHFKCL